MNLILFDVAGTLVRSADFEQPVLIQSVARALEVPTRVVEEFRPEETETAFVDKVWRLVKGASPTTEEWNHIYQTYQEQLHKTYGQTAQRFASMEGAPDLLRNLQTSTSWGFAIATSSWHELAHLSLRSSGFYTRRIHVVTGEGVYKKTELLTKAIESSKRWYGVSEFDRVTYVGDEALDTAACREMNLPFIEVGELESAKQETGIRFPEKSKFIRLARRASVPSRVRQQSLVSLMGLRT